MVYRDHGYPKVRDSLLGGLVIEILMHGGYVGHCVH